MKNIYKKNGHIGDSPLYNDVLYMCLPRDIVIIKINSNNYNDLFDSKEHVQMLEVPWN